MSLDPHLHLRRRKDGVEVITLVSDKPAGHARRAYVSDFTPVRYVESGRKGYLKDNILEVDFVVLGKANPAARWSNNPLQMYPDGTIHAESAAAMETLRDRDIAQKRKEIMTKVFSDRQSLTPGAQAALDQAIHIILAGV